MSKNGKAYPPKVATQLHEEENREEYYREKANSKPYE
jgi:hypothetical protein